MRIWLFITNLQGGGAERTFINLSAWLGDRGHQVKLVLLEHRIDFKLPPSVSVHCVSPNRRDISKSWLGKHTAAHRLANWIRRQPATELPDLVISTLPFTDEIVSRVGLPNVWYRISNPLSMQIAALREVSERRALRRLNRFRRLYEGKNLISISQGVTDDLREKLGIRPATIETIYNPFDFDEIKRLAAAAEPALPKEPFIVHVGRMVPQKRHDLLLDAYVASGLPHRLVLLTRDLVRTRELIASRGLTGRVTIAGFRQNPYPWFAKAVALVHSADFEGFGNVLVDALACGTPVVSTDCPVGPREILSGPLSRYLVPCGDAQALARKLVECVTSPPVIEPEMLKRFSKGIALDAIEALATRNYNASGAPVFGAAPAMERVA